MVFSLRPVHSSIVCEDASTTPLRDAEHSHVYILMADNLWTGFLRDFSFRMSNA
jgi:hypothetical protein